MNIRYYIASLAFAAIIMTSCQKDEFSEIMVREVAQEEARQSDESAFDSNAGGAIDPDDHIKKDDPLRNSDSGVVKEVSDGDEESDDDDNTATQ